MTSTRVVELSGDTAAQVCGRLFAGFGHEVLRCEPPGGDPGRTREPVDASGVNFTYATLNADKRAVPEDELERLLAHADLLVTDLGPRRAAARGLTPERIRRDWPRLVVAWLTPYGLDDDRSDQHSDSLLAESYGGLATMIGEPDRAPLSLGGEQTAHAAAFVGFYGAMLALRRREHTGAGDVVDVALCDVAAHIDWKSDVIYAHGGNVPNRAGVFTGPWRIVPAADGWVGIVFQPDQWDTVRGLVGDPALDDPRLRDEAGRAELAGLWWPVIERWAARLPKREVYERAQALGLAFGFSADVADICASEQYRARGFVAGQRPRIGPIPRLGALAWRCGSPPELDGRADGALPAARRAPAVDGTAPAPLSGVVVLDLGTITAGAAAGRLLADYGATVIKIESPNRPDSFRLWPAMGTELADSDSDGDSPLFESNNAGKLGVTLDLKTEAGRATMARLVADADVLLENFTVGVTERLGIDHATLTGINPRLIYVSLSSQGQSGPEARGRSYGSTLDLLSGLASVTGYPGGGPIWSSADVNYPDQLVALFAAGLVGYCLHHDVRGQHLDISQRELVTWTLADRIAEYAATGRVAAPTGNRRPGSTPHDVYPCLGADQWIALACRTDAERAALAGVIGAAELAGHPESWWLANQERVDRVISDWTAARSRTECVATLTEAGISCAPVYTAADRARDPHFRDRRVYLDRTDEHPRSKGFPMRLREYDPPRPSPAPDLGRDNATVFGARRPWTEGTI
ncbi:CaiB/BaiF CoA-transferase family protein [Pseudonocardia acaciae]|uniref:CaiB/BaiF CoA-transferase family protein n=1 Tax=Pseudonocardia acaciae TaxID=551276 RepID=UPI00048BF20E|nr:CoA transferase [Pseudonocardia acaciae]